MTDPTELDKHNAATRQAIAARQNEAYYEAERLALAALGSGWKPWMKLVLLDADHRRNGNREPVATVYKVYHGEQKLTDNSVFIRRMPNGKIKVATAYEPLFGDLLTEKHPTRTIDVRGERVPVSRYELCWSALELYFPRSAEALAADRERREEKDLQREADDNPLYRNQILSEGYQKPPRKRGR